MRCSDRIRNDQLLLLTLEWLDDADLMAFDTASQSNGCMAPTWLRVIRSHADIRHIRGMLYTPLWIRWLLDGGVRTSSLRIGRRTKTDRMTDVTFEAFVYLRLQAIAVINGYRFLYDQSDTTVRLMAIGCVNLLNIKLVDCRNRSALQITDIGGYKKM